MRSVITWCLLVLLCGVEVPARAEPGRAFAGGDRILYAAKTEAGSASGGNGDSFSISEDEATFFVANGAGPLASAASVVAGRSFDAFYAMTRDEEATWPFAFNRKLSYVENRLVGGLRWANTKLRETPLQRATAVAAVVFGTQISIAHVGLDRAYLIRAGQLRQLTTDHTMAEEVKRASAAAGEELGPAARPNVLARALGRRPSVEVDVVTEKLLIGDRILLCSEGLYLSLKDEAILHIIGRGGADKAALEDTVKSLVARSALLGRSDATVILLGFEAKR